MISRINNDNSFFRPVDGLDSEQESVKSTQAESAKPAMITEIGFPKFAAASNSPASPESTSIAADGKSSLMNMRAGLLKKSLNESLSSPPPTSGKAFWDLMISNYGSSLKQPTEQVEPTSVEFPNLKAEEKKS